MVIKIIKVGYLQSNCYILEKDNHTLIIDPGDEYDKIISNINYPIDAILITHHHSDHYGALKYFDKSIPVYAYDNIKDFKSTIFNLKSINTPGHSHDSITIIFKDEKVMFTGDFLFKGDIGRTDFKDGSDNDMEHSIKRIRAYRDDYEVYPGHGESTTLGEEKLSNIYFNNTNN
jgi:hydroxyacylglutathione hydrolase